MNTGWCGRFREQSCPRRDSQPTRGLRRDPRSFLPCAYATTSWDPVRYRGKGGRKARHASGYTGDHGAMCLHSQPGRTEVACDHMLASHAYPLRLAVAFDRRPTSSHPAALQPLSAVLGGSSNRNHTRPLGIVTCIFPCCRRLYLLSSPTRSQSRAHKFTTDKMPHSFQHGGGLTE